MQEARGILRRGDHFELADVEGVHLGQIGAAALGDVGEHLESFFAPNLFARQQAAQNGIPMTRRGPRAANEAEISALGAVVRRYR